MYIAISAQKMASTYQASVSNFVSYLQKENDNLTTELQEHFFDQNNDRVSPNMVIEKIDRNTAKLSKQEPKFYSIVLSPSARELAHIENSSEKLKAYTRAIMQDYVKAFYRDFEVSVKDIRYYAKIEHQRFYKGFDKEVRNNAVYRNKIAKLQHDLVKIRKGQLEADPKSIQKKIKKLEAQIPHRLNGQIIKEGMLKPGMQKHVHIIISKKDVTNTFRLSPGAKAKESETSLNGKTVKTGFNRDQFYQDAEKTFDKLFGYQRNYVEQYQARKVLQANPALFFKVLLKMPTSQKNIAFQILRKQGMPIPSIPLSQSQLAFKTLIRLKKQIQIAVRSSGIEI